MFPHTINLEGIVQCLGHSRHPVNVYGINEGEREER